MGSRPAVGRWIIWAAVLIVAAFVLGWLQRSPSDTSEAAFQQAVHAALATARSHRAGRQRLQATADSAAAAAAGWRHQARLLATANDSLEAATAGRALTAAEDSVLHTGFRVQIQALARLAMADSVRADAEGDRADSAEARIAELEGVLQLAPEPCRILFWDCPSRKTAFWVGVGVGAAGMTALAIAAP